MDPGAAPEVPGKNPQPETSEAKSATHSEVESAVNHHRRKITLCNSVFTDEEFKAFSSVDAYLGAARAGLEIAVRLLSTNLQVINLYLPSC